MALLRQHYTFQGQGKDSMEQKYGEGGGGSIMHSYSFLSYHLSSDSQKYL